MRLIDYGETTCTKCQGSGTSSFNPDRTCCYCDGERTFPLLDFDALIARVTVGRGKFRASRPARATRDATAAEKVLATRSYYVWRMARFHGGADVCMPVVAQIAIAGDPAKQILHDIAEKVAIRAFGTDMAAAFRWSSALGSLPTPPPSGLPASAYPGGPTFDEHKPEDEWPETK